MDISSFTVSGAAPAATVAPPTGAPAPTLPASMVEQRIEAIPVEETTAAPASETPTGQASAASEAPAAPASTPTAEEILAAARAAAESKVEPERPAKVDPKFSALARKEAELHRAREAMKAEKAAIEEAHRQVVAFEEARHAAKRDPVAALQALGISYDDLTEHVLNGGKPTPSAEVAALREELDQLRVEQETARARAEEAAAARLAAEHSAVIEEARSEAVAFVEANSSRYELTSINGAATLVPQVREQHFARTGKLLTVEQAADLVEKHFESLADRIAKARKVQAKAAPAAPAPAASPPAERRTLSNSLTASTSSAPPKPRTEADRIRAALARLEGK